MRVLLAAVCARASQRSDGMPMRLLPVLVTALATGLFPVPTHGQSSSDSLAVVQAYLDHVAAPDSVLMTPYHPAGTPRSFCTSWATRFGRDLGEPFPNPRLGDLLRRQAEAHFDLDSVDRCIIDERRGYVDSRQRPAVEISVGIVTMTESSATLFFGISPWMWPGAGALECHLIRTPEGWVVQSETCRGWDT